MAKIYHMRANAGDSVPTDLVNGNPATIDPGMNLSLVQDSGRWSWRVPNPSSTLQCSHAFGSTYSVNTGAPGGGATQIIRCRVDSPSVGGDAQVGNAWSVDVGNTYPMRYLTRAGGYSGRYPPNARTEMDGFDNTTTMRTIVIKYRQVDPISVAVDIWIDKAVEGGGPPDYSGSAAGSNSATYYAAGFRATAGVSYYITDHVIFNEELPDLDCESAAFNLDAYLGFDVGPSLSNPTVTVTSATTADGAVDSSAPSDGTIDVIASVSPSPPSETQLKAGQESTGITADWSALAQAMGVNPQAWSATGLTQGQAYKFFSGQTDATAAFSNIAESASFTPNIPPVLSNPTGVATGQSTADGGVDTDTLSDGTLDVIASTSATPPSETQLKAGQDSSGSAAPWSSLAQAVTGTNPQTWSATGLTAATVYYFYAGQTDGLGTFSNITSDQFTTDAPTAVKIVFLEPLKQYDGLLWASLGSLSVRVYNDNMSALVWQTDAGITDAGGILAEITDPALVDGTFYRVVVFDATRASRPYRIQALNQ